MTNSEIFHAILAVAFIIVSMVNVVFSNWDVATFMLLSAHMQMGFVRDDMK